MKKLIFLNIMIVFFAFSGEAQRYVTKNGHIKFYSETPMETIEAHNNSVNSALDITTGDIVFKVLIKSFEFEKALMQEHFNENYLESDEYPNATLKGKIANLDEIDLTTPGNYDAVIEGDLTIHGVTQQVKEKGTLVVSNDKMFVKGNAVFSVLLKDYKIKIPKAVTENIAETIEVTVDINLKSL